MIKTVILSRMAWDGALNAWQEFMEIEIDVPEPPRPDMEWHICGEKISPEEFSVDAVEVVRCKECKHWYEYSCNEEYGSCHFWQANDNENTETESDDFCSYGQRKDGAE